MQISLDPKSNRLVHAVMLLLALAIGLTAISYGMASRRARVEHERADEAEARADQLVATANAATDAAHLARIDAQTAWATAEALRQQRTPIPPKPAGPPPPSGLADALLKMGLHAPGLIHSMDQPVVWNWGQEALRVPGLEQAVTDRERESDSFRNAAQKAQVAAQDAESAVGQWKAAYGAEKDAAGHLRASLAAQRTLPWGVGAVFGSSGEKGVVVQRDWNVFRIGGEVTQRNGPTGLVWNSQVQLIYRF